MHDARDVYLEVPESLEPELERQLREYAQMREMSERMSEQGIDPLMLN
jgi:hypothetical protein